MAKQDKPKQKKVPQSNPWDIPSLPEKGDEADSLTYEAVGRALSAWESFELELSRIFGALIGAHEGLLAAMRAYGSVVAFRGRAEMVAAASEVFFLVHANEKLEGDLASLMKLAKNYSARRNEIAHGIVLEFAQFAAEREGFCLGPPAYATNKQELTSLADGLIIRNAARYCYTSRELNNFRDRFYDDLFRPAQKLMMPLHLRRAASP